VRVDDVVADGVVVQVLPVFVGQFGHGVLPAI
jgi:hypothetical protein